MTHEVELPSAAPMPPSSRSPARVALAAAIKGYEAAKRAVKANEAGQAAAFQIVLQARSAVKDALAAVDEAKKSAAQHAADAMRGKTRTVPPSIKIARQDAQDAQDNLEAAESARATLIAENAEVTRTLAGAEWKLRSAIEGVFKESGEATELLEKYTAAFRAFVDLRRAVEFLWGKDLLPQRSEIWRQEQDWPDLPGAEPWRSAFDALHADADAQLPMVK
jgi:hypothetical protein